MDTTNIYYLTSNEINNIHKSNILIFNTILKIIVISKEGHTDNIDYLPPLLTHLIFNDDVIYNYSFDNILPDSLIILKLNDIYNIPLPKLPKSLKQLILGVHYDHPITSDIIPSTLKYIQTSIKYRYKLPILPVTN
jgi:hypothetical protein